MARLCGSAPAFACAVLLAFACGSDPSSPRSVVVDATPIERSKAASPQAEAPPDDGSQPIAPRKSTPGAAVTTEVDTIGMPECDLYVARMQACFGKLAPDVRTSLEEEIRAMREIWTTITDETGRQAIRQACSTAAEAWLEIPNCK